MNSNGALHFSLVALAGFAVSMPLAGAAEPEGSNVRFENPADVANARLPMDLARGSVGARIQVRAPKGAGKEDDQENRSAQALISDDATLGYPLTPGVTSILVTLPKIEVLSRFNFISYDAGGEVSIAASSVKLPFDSADWRTVSNGRSFESQQVVACPLGSIEARYLKFDFNTRTPGRIASLGLFGLPKISNFKVQPMSFNYAASGGIGRLQGRSVFFDYANIYTGANVVAVSNGGQVEKAQAMIDGNPETNYTFDPSDPCPSMVIDLGVRRSLNRVSCVYQAGPGKLDVYLVDNPGMTDGFQRVALNYLDSPQSGGAISRTGIGTAQRQPLMSVDTSANSGIGHASADLTGQSGRFLIAEFHPTATEPDFKDRDFKDFKDRDFKDSPAPVGDASAPGSRYARDVAASSVPFKVLSFSAFGEPPHGQIITRLPTTPLNPNGNPPGGGQFPPPPQGTSVVSP